MSATAARLLDLLHAGHDYADDVRRLEALIDRSARAPVRTLLDVGCGTGAHLWTLRDRYDAEGLDLDEAVLAVARERLPDVPLHRADMVGFDLGRRFDAVVCLGGTIGYARTPERLERTLRTFARHTAAGGVVIVAPWVYPNEWIAGHADAELVDLPDLKVALVRVTGGGGRLSTLDEHYLVAERGAVEHVSERHELGLFTRDEYAAAFAAAGLAATFVADGLAGWDLVVGVRG